MKPPYKPSKNWEVFEHEVRMLVEAFGYKAETTQPSHDYGVDVIAENQRRRVVIQCKLYGRGRIGGETIMKLVGSRVFFQATDALCITTSRFTRQAREIADKQNVRLVDQQMLLALCMERNLTIPSLTVLQTEQEDVLPLQEAQVTLGRADDNSIVLTDAQVSRHHAVLERTELHLILRDCSSTNGTSVDGQRITDPTRLNYGSVIGVGAFRMTVRFRGPANALGRLWHRVKIQIIPE